MGRLFLIMIALAGASAGALAQNVGESDQGGRIGLGFRAAQAPDDGEREPTVDPAPADLAAAIKIAEKHTGGKAAGAETVERDGQKVHEVRILLDDGGRVRTVRVDPATGAIIPQERPQR